jgi:hypothetical protein
VAVGQYSLFPDKIIHQVSFIVPWIEFGFGTYLLLGYMQEISAGALAVLAGFFQLVIGQALLRRLPMDECGCFGGGFIHFTLYQSFVLDTLLVVILVQLAAPERTIFSVDNYLLKKPHDATAR